MKTQQKKINIKRLKSRLDQMASIRKTDKGGVTRPALSIKDGSSMEKKRILRENILSYYQHTVITD
ncbi:hypothetical protein [Peribacillus butanolivorans]|uniref:hypothetical protein n=1 Tax=Peribacillus butanolivorans TaxID=421767 RepID=UPI00366DA861